MSNHFDDPWEAEMSRQFDQRVRDLHEAPLSFDHVKGKAMKIRRTRRVAAAGGILAAAAVIIPVAVFAGQGLTDKDSGPGPANPNPTVIDPGSSGFGYLEGKTLHLADGSTMKLPKTYYAVTVLGDTAFAVRNDDDTGQDYLDVFEGSATNEIQSGPVVNDAHTSVAYIERDGELVIQWDDGDQVIGSTSGPSEAVAAVAGCRTGTDSCRVYINDDSTGVPTVFDTNAGRETAVPGAIKVSDAAEAGLVAVQNGFTDDGSCWGVYDESADDYLWETCDYSLYAFSPDSKYVDATDAYRDSIGNAYAEILDAATGKPVGARLQPPEGLIRQTMWQDSEHLLATVYDPQGWSIYRMGVDGSIEQVVGPSTEGNPDTPAYTLVNGS
jgi:hypothetical protein